MSASTGTSTQESTQRLPKLIEDIIAQAKLVTDSKKKGQNKMKQGDIVFLNSGSPELTVESITGEFVKCIWFDGNVAESGIFHSACLTLKK